MEGRPSTRRSSASTLERVLPGLRPRRRAKASRQAAISGSSSGARSGPPCRCRMPPPQRSTASGGSSLGPPVTPVRDDEQRDGSPAAGLALPGPRWPRPAAGSVVGDRLATSRLLADVRLEDGQGEPRRPRCGRIAVCVGDAGLEGGGVPGAKPTGVAGDGQVHDPDQDVEQLPGAGAVRARSRSRPRAPSASPRARSPPVGRSQRPDRRAACRAAPHHRRGTPPARWIVTLLADPRRVRQAREGRCRGRRPGAGAWRCWDWSRPARR